MTKLLTKLASILAAFGMVVGTVPASAFALVLDPIDPAAVTASSTPATDSGSASSTTTNLLMGTMPLDPMLFSQALFAATSSTVNTQAEFEAAMANRNVTTITIASDIQITSTLNITRSVTIEGAGHTITVTDAVAGSSILVTGSNVTVRNLIVDSSGKLGKRAAGIQGIQAYQATNVTLDHVTSKNAGKSGIMVNGSTVKVINVSTSGNTWHGINVDQGSGVESPAILTISGTSTHGESSLFNPAIYVDNTSRGSVTGDTDQYIITHLGSAVEYNLDPNYHAVPACGTDNHSLDTFNVGSVNGQYSWMSTGPFDQAIVKNTYGFASFGCKSLRISNAVTSGSFGDQTFAAPQSDEAGESAASSTSFAAGTRKTHFDAQFDIASTKQVYQPGLALSVAPDRGDGARMSYLRFEDNANGINVFFDDVQGTSSDPETRKVSANFVETQIAGGTASTSALSRTVPHTISFSMDLIDGPKNDVVKVFIDGALVQTGTSWEDYYRYDPEQAGSGNAVPTVKTLLFRAGGTAVPSNKGNGFLFDNVNLSTSNTVTVPSTNNGGGSTGGTDTRTVGGGGGGGGGSSSNSGSAPTSTSSSGSTSTTNGGQVLGATAFNFTRDLHMGLRGADVMELQTELIAAGYLKIPAATGYFGKATRAAVAKWQAEHGISPAVGYFGKLSRAKYAADGGFHLMVIPVTTITASTTTSH